MIIAECLQGDGSGVRLSRHDWLEGTYRLDILKLNPFGDVETVQSLESDKWNLPLMKEALGA